MKLADIKTELERHPPDGMFPLYAVTEDGPGDSYRVLAVGRRYVHLLTFAGREQVLPELIRRVWS